MLRTMRVKERKRAMVKRVRPRMMGWVFVVRRMESIKSDIVTRLARSDAAC